MLRDLALLVSAQALLRACRPLRAHAILVRIGAWLPSIQTPNEALRMARGFGHHGTCLSRSLAVAARAPTADVVIAVEPKQDAPLFAHAWVEMDGAPIDPADVAGQMIARIRGPRSVSPAA
jgi:hypothetical protein